MNELNKQFRIKGILKYFIFIMAFICCGFVFSSTSVEAAPEISIPDDSNFNYSEGLYFYVGYDVVSVSEVKYSFNNGSNWTTISKPTTNYSALYKGDSAKNLCNNSSFIGTCTSVIIRYHIASSNLPNSTSNGVNSNGKFTLTVYSKGLGSSKESKTLTYDGTGPSISKIIVSKGDTSSSKFLVAGKKINFSVMLSENATVSSGAFVYFKIGDTTRGAACNANTSLSNLISCSYTIASGDTGELTSFSFANGNIYVKDQYNNKMSSSSISVTNVEKPELVVDTTKPSISSVVAQAGIYSTGNSIPVEITFNEKIVVASSWSAPVLTVKFGSGKNKTCSFENGVDTTLTYVCDVNSDDQGALTFVSLTGGSGFSDEAGNALNLTKSSFVIDGVIIDNNLPTIDRISVSTNGCDDIYCIAGNKLTIDFKFNMSVTLNSTDVNLMFGGVGGKNSAISSYDATAKTLQIVYTIHSGDNGKFSVNYDISVKGVNGISVNLSNVKEFEYYIDNKNPEVSLEEINVEDKAVVGNVIYGAKGSNIVFELSVTDDSVVSLDSSKIYLVDENNNRLYSSSENIDSISSVLEDDKLLVTIHVAKSINIKIKLKIEAGALKDVLNNTLISDFYSDLYILDCSVPEFTILVKYPEYKQYKKGNQVVLISGNTIDFVISSSQQDLVEYCVTESSDEECSYSELNVGETYSYSFNESGSKEYSFYVRVKDVAGNESEGELSFVLQDMFNYSNGVNSVSKQHSITIDTSLLTSGEIFKYSWFKEGSAVNFSGANTSAKDDGNSFAVNGDATYNGNYKVCILISSSNDVLCSEYVNFDTKIDSFNVEINTSWVNESLPVTINFNDVSAIKCIAIGKDVSDLNCTNGGDNKYIYKTSQISNPFKGFSITSNGVYHFYIEDMVGNSSKITRVVTNMDDTPINIEIFNGNSDGYNTNLEVGTYKNNHKFLVMFDKNGGESPVSLYKYFFSKNTYNINNKDSFDIYYLNNSIKAEANTSSNSVIITAPSTSSGIYNLYIMAIDQAGNVAISSVSGIYVDVEGPVIKMYDSNNLETNGGSSEYITSFEYTIEIKEEYSKLNLNSVYYKWVRDDETVVLQKKYEACSFDYNICKINGKDIEFGAGLFDPSRSYRLVFEASDNANNSSSFRSELYKIDTTPPIIEFLVQDKWYTSNSFSFTVSKTNNIGTLSNIAYCLNQCLVDEKVDLSKFQSLVVSNPTSDTKTVILSLNQGNNKLYVYASDVFGNVNVSNINIKYDTVNPFVTVNNLSDSGVVDLSDASESVIDFTVGDATSDVNKYCLYLDNSLLKCVNDGNTSEKYEVSMNGSYYIEVYDNAGKIYKHNVNVVGIDKEPIAFDLISNVASGKFTNSDVTISVVNMRKFMNNDVSDYVSNIDYIVLDTYDSNYVNLFDDCVSVYNASLNNTLVTSFTVSENKVYVVRIIDTAGNVSYNYIDIQCIDKVKPFINTDKLNSNDRIFLSTSSGSYIVKESDTEYKYANETLYIKFGQESFKDLYNGFNNYLGVRVCFEEVGECVYNTYNVSSSLNGSYLTNAGIVSVSAPYHFSGVIRYYLIDGAGNESNRYSFDVTYQNEATNVTVSLLDSNDESISEENKYREIKAVFNIANTSQTEVRYALVASSIDLNYEFANKNITNGEFLSAYSFVNASSSVTISKENVDSSYYIWLFVSDVFGNFKLYSEGTLVHLDTKAPTFNEVEIEIDRIGDTSYDLTVGSDFEDTLYIDVKDGNGYKKVEFVDRKYTFTVGAVDSISLQLEDLAGNKSEIKNVSLSEVSATQVYGRAYQNGNERKATLVIYNKNNKNITSFKYIVTSVNNTTITEDSLQSLDECMYDADINCYIENSYSKITDEVYSVSVSQDRRVVLFVYVDSQLVYDRNGDLLFVDLIVDSSAPEVVFSGTNPNVISTSVGEYTFGVEVSDSHLTNLSGIKYVITTSSFVSNFDSVYSACINSNSCARGVYDLNSSLSGNIVINSNSSAFANLQTGAYYIHTQVSDDYNNSVIKTSDLIFIDNTGPSVSYSTGSDYKDIVSEIFVGQAATVKFTDNRGVSYFNILNNTDQIIATCHVGKTSGDYNCNKEVDGNYSEIGNSIFYKLDTGNYKIVVYDIVSNSKTVYINVDSNAPAIKLYKKIGSEYVLQPSEGKTYNALDNLYLQVVDNNFNYLVIDLENTVTGNKIPSAVRYSYNSEIGICLIDSNECSYGALVKDILVTNEEYNKIIIKVYDKSNSYSEMIIAYDDVVPVIWTRDVEENVKIDGVFYLIKENVTLDFEIGVGSLNLDKVLNSVILNVDGYSYTSVKNSDLFVKTVYKKVDGLFVIFSGDIFAHIGEYKIELDYTDEAGNEAVTKVIYVNVLDNTYPELSLEDNDLIVELNEEVVIDAVKATDNYGLDGSMTKEKNLYLSDATTCVVDGVNCGNEVSKISNNIYKFTKAGVYVFGFNVSDISGNISSINYTITVIDSKGPDMSISGAQNIEIEIVNKDNINAVAVTYPTGYDNGDMSVKEVKYVGLFSVNNMQEKYEIKNDTFIINNAGNVLTYKFDKVGVYYLRFISSDSKGNSTTYEYEVRVVDKIAPMINGITNGQVIDVNLGSEDLFDVEDLISEYSISVSDNYDENMKLNYVRKGNTVEFSASDSSNNNTTVVVTINVIDNEKPIVGTLKVDRQTNANNLTFEIIGGTDNSNNYWHEYSLDNINWVRYSTDSSISLGNNISKTIMLCIRAVDGSMNYSENRSCENILVDTKKPTISGVKDGDVSSVEITLGVSDDNLDTVKVYKDDELLEISIADLPYALTEVGKYSVIATDTLGNVSYARFVVSLDVYMDVVNDLNADEYTVTSVDFNERRLVKVDVNYDNSGNASISVDLDNIQVEANSVVYILGMVPNTNSAFVMYSLNGADIAKYYGGLQLIGDANSFIEGVNNEDCLIKFEDTYFAYLMVKESESANQTITTNSDNESKDDSGFLKTVLIVLGSLVALVLGYQILKLRKRVRAA